MRNTRHVQVSHAGWAHGLSDMLIAATCTWLLHHVGRELLMDVKVCCM